MGKNSRDSLQENTATVSGSYLLSPQIEQYILFLVSERYLKSCRFSLSLLSLFHTLVLAKGGRHLILHSWTWSSLQTKTFCLIFQHLRKWIISILFMSWLKASSGQLYHMWSHVAKGRNGRSKWECTPAEEHNRVNRRPRYLGLTNRWKLPIPYLNCLGLQIQKRDEECFINQIRVSPI